jgi:transposase InsO family protein
VNQAPAEVHATLLDEGVYHASVSTYYRLLHRHEEVQERRNQARHPVYTKPELVAEQPNQVWSWDITVLRGPEKWRHYYLYVILDIYSRYIVGWMIAERQTAHLATRLIRETVVKHRIKPAQLILHADRGAAMTAKTTAQLLGTLGVCGSHSRPQVSDDNPYSESNFKTLKYNPEFPGRFGSIEDSRSFVSRFVTWYNEEHHHSGIAMLTPHSLHFGQAEDILTQRQQVLDRAYDLHPERFVLRRPQVPPAPAAAWINQPPTNPKP